MLVSCANRRSNQGDLRLPWLSRNSPQVKVWTSRTLFHSAYGKSWLQSRKAMSPPGDVARLAGSPRAARQVGGVLKNDCRKAVRCQHRVVNRHGAISLTGPDLQRQRQALLSEGAGVRVGSDPFTEVPVGVLTLSPEGEGTNHITSASVGLAGTADWFCGATGTSVCCTGTSSGRFWFHCVNRFLDRIGDKTPSLPLMR